MSNISADLSVKLSVQNTLTPSVYAGSVSFVAPLAKALSWATTGSGANKFNVSYIADRTVTALTPDTIDLSGTLKQPDGVTAAVFTDLQLLIIINKSATVGQNLLVGGANGPAGMFSDASDVIVVLPGGILILGTDAVAGYAVTNSTADLITVNVAAGTAVPYAVAALGH